jgi:hypothetical protein
MNLFPPTPGVSYKGHSKFKKEKILSKICGDICSSRCTTGVTKLVANGKNLQLEKY